MLDLPIESIKRLPGVSGIHARPWVWVIARTFGWISKYRRLVRDCETGPDHHEAMVATMLRRLARK